MTDRSGMVKRADRLLVKAAVLVAAVMALPAIGATYTWTSGTSGNWSDSSKWDAAGVPLTDGTADITFKYSGGGPIATIDSAWASGATGSINKLSFDTSSSGGNVAIRLGTGVTGLTLGAGGIVIPSGNRTIGELSLGNLTLSSSQIWNIGGTNYANTWLNTNWISAADVTVVKEGTGFTTIAGGSSSNFLGSFALNNGGIIFANTSVLNNLGSQALKVLSFGASTSYGGVTVPASGTSALAFGFNDASATYSQNVTFLGTDGTTSTANTKGFLFKFDNTAGTISTITLSGQMTGILSSAASVGTVLNFTSTYYPTIRSNVFKITGNNSTLSSTSSSISLAGFYYPVAIPHGYVVLDNPNALGTGNSIPVGLGEAGSYNADAKDPGGTYRPSVAGVVAGLLATNGNNVSSQIRLRQAGAYAYNYSPNIGVLGLEGTGSVTFSGNIYLNSANDAKAPATLELTAPTGGTAVFNSVIADAGPDLTALGGGGYTVQANKARVAVMGQGTVELNGNNTYAGTTTVRSGSLVIGHDSALGTAASAVNLGDTTIAPVTVKVAAPTKLGGTYNNTAGTLTFGSNLTALDGYTLQDGDRILVFNQTNQYGGPAQEQNGIYVYSSATPKVLTRATDFDAGSEFNYGQQLTIQSGSTYGGKTFYVTNRTDVAPITLGYQGIAFGLDYLNPGTSVLLKSGITLARNVNVLANGTSKSTLGSSSTTGSSIFSGAVTLAKDLTVTAASGGDVTFSGNITGGFGLTKEGDGKVVFSTNKGYTGTTAITAGVLEVDATLASTQVNVATGGKLVGSGNLAGQVTVLGDLAPGNSIGTITVGGLTVGDGGKLTIELGSAGSSDKVVVNGNIDLSSVLDSIVFTGTADLSVPYVIATYTGTLVGTFNTAANLPANMGLDYGTGSNSQIILKAIPEPASLGLLALGSVLIAGHRPRTPRPRKSSK